MIIEKILLLILSLSSTSVHHMNEFATVFTTKELLPFLFREALVHTHTHTHAHTHTYAHTYIHAHIYLHKLHVYARIQLHIRIHIHTPRIHFW